MPITRYVAILFPPHPSRRGSDSPHGYPLVAARPRVPAAAGGRYPTVPARTWPKE